MPRPRIAVTSGDPAGIGPEIVARASVALRSRIADGELSLLLIGASAAHKAALRQLSLEDVATPVSSAGPGDDLPPIGFVDIDQVGQLVPPGRSTAEGGRIAYDAIAAAVRLALAGAVDAICTGPISKEALNFAGHHYSGHTELLADLTGARDSVMLLAHGAMRVSHMTTHTALEDVPKRVTPERLSRVVALTDEALARSARHAAGSRSRRSIRTRARAGCSDGRISTSSSRPSGASASRATTFTGRCPATRCS